MGKAQPQQVIAEFCADLSFEALSVEVVDAAKAKILDSLAAAYAGKDEPIVRVVEGFSSEAPDGPSAQLLARKTLPPADAAFANSVYVHSVFHDDTDLESGHPGCVVFPPALAVAESVSASGRDLILAVVLGYESMWRMGGCGAFFGNATRRGFRAMAMLGAFGSATASAKLMRLGAPETANALSAAASVSTALLEPMVHSSTMDRFLHQANNARQGVMVAGLAAAGFEASPTVLTNPAGYLRAFADLQDYPAEALATLGSEYRIGKVWAKPYPSSGSNSVAIAVGELALSRLDPDDRSIEHIRLKVLPRFTGTPGYPQIASMGPFETLDQALISFPSQMALLALTGEVTLEGTKRHMGTPQLEAMAQKVEIEGVEVPYPLWCSVELVSSSGTSVVADADEIDWDHFYLTPELASARFMKEAPAVLGFERASKANEALLNLDHVDVADLSPLLAVARLPN